jgi:hypothetical protein
MGLLESDSVRSRQARCTQEKEISRHSDHQKIPTGRVLRASYDAIWVYLLFEVGPATVR